MADEVLVDSGAWIGVANPRDTYHDEATSIYRRLVVDQVPLVTTDLIVAESYNLIRRTRGSAGAFEFLRRLRRMARITRVPLTPLVAELAEQLLEQYADQDFSYVDAVSFVVMRERGIVNAFAFDHHFMTAGFVTVSAAQK